MKYNAVEPGYFRAMGMPLLQGSTFTDTTAASQELIVNEGFARKYWREQSAVGRRVRIVQVDGRGDWKTIVGVVGDAATGGLTDQRSDPFLYLPISDYERLAIIFRARPGFDPAPELRAIVADLDPELSPPTLVDIQRAMLRSIEQPRFTMTLLAAFSVVALALAAVGLYGVMAYMVVQRTREIGIRLALGATRLGVARSVVANGLALAAVGIVVGSVGAWWATRFLEGMLYGVTTSDPASFALSGAVLLATAMVACAAPSARATSIDPLISIRAE
jgi:putative ABC transport system permease protein